MKVSDRRADVLLAVGTAVFAVGATYGRLSASGMPERPLDGSGVVLLVVSALFLAARRAAPAVAGPVTAGSAVLYYAAGYPGIFALGPVMVTIYTAAALGRRRLAVTLAVALAGGLSVVVALSPADPEPGGLSLLSGWLVAMVVAGESVRGRRAYLREVERRAAEAERTREEAALRRAGEERLWIAQELHDTLTHAISVINVQAAVATHLLDRRPEQARAALAAIKDSGHEAMRELRATLGVLRQADAGEAEAGLARLPRLVARAEAAGLPVRMAVVGEPGPLPPAADRAAYRIAQEALTNVMRHAGAGAVTVTTEYRPRTLVLRVADDGRGAAPGSERGMGLIGMRERAVSAGGTLLAGPGPAGGFEVRAELPRAES
ncbi:sensor histidine kinase [Sphaerisporangium rufum]|uniref:sensor histidine kinase n=1 Tax=Sphaerisporangium rufum TaxID=1381558 RepID=UPI001EF1E5D0|nr:sensor histidine kinase [Sphaerisporangium rufum]